MFPDGSTLNRSSQLPILPAYIVLTGSPKGILKSRTGNDRKPTSGRAFPLRFCLKRTPRLVTSSFLKTSPKSAKAKQTGTLQKRHPQKTSPACLTSAFSASEAPAWHGLAGAPIRPDRKGTTLVPGRSGVVPAKCKSQTTINMAPLDEDSAGFTKMDGVPGSAYATLGCQIGSSPCQAQKLSNMVTCLSRIREHFSVHLCCGKTNPFWGGQIHILTNE